MSNSNLPMQAMKEIPTPQANAKQITALVKDSGRVVGYQLSDGSILSKEQAIQQTRQGSIQGVGIATRNGSEYLKSLPDGNEGNNLSSLPSILRS